MGMELPSYSKNEVVNNEVLEPEEELGDWELAQYVRVVLKSVDPETQSQFQNLESRNHYNELVGYLIDTKRRNPDEVAALVASLKALSRAVSYIDVDVHKKLLNAIFSMSMWFHGPEVMDALVELIISLATSGGQFVDACLDMLVRNFMPPKTNLAKWGRSDRKTQVLDRVHSALNDIADVLPLAALRLESIVVDRMPHKLSTEDVVIYAESMLRLESGVLGKFVGTRMLSEIMNMLLDLDVEIGWDIILQDDHSKGIFDMELGEDLEENAACAEKLDNLMVLTCEYLKSCANEGRLVEVFELLLVLFEKMVLTAYKSKFVQFVIFYACSLDPENCGVRFAIMLADIFEHSTYTLNRMSAVAYLASYLSRARFMSPSLVLSALERLVDWCFKYCKLQDGEVEMINPEGHKEFYAACQAVMYVLCFRMRFMMDVPHLKSQLLRIPLEPILRHPLDPLKVCLPTIVIEFLRQAKAARLFFVSEKFFFNNLLESEFSKAFGGKERLDMFFPFDPLLLKNCDRFIRPNFIYWSMVQTTYDEDEDEDEDASSDDDDEEDFEDDRSENLVHDDMGRSFDEDTLELDEFEYSLNKMSITPKSSVKYLAADLQMSRHLSKQLPARISNFSNPESL